jgi:hypothetical protein
MESPSIPTLIPVIEEFFGGGIDVDGKAEDVVDVATDLGVVPTTINGNVLTLAPSEVVPRPREDDAETVSTLDCAN